MYRESLLLTRDGVITFSNAENGRRGAIGNGKRGSKVDTLQEQIANGVFEEWQRGRSIKEAVIEEGGLFRSYDRESCVT